MPMPQDWMAAGACRGVPINLFFPAKGQSADAAREICSSCPVLAACADFAMSDDGPIDGFLGGMAAHERRRLRVELRRGNSPAPTPRRRGGSRPQLLPPFPRLKAETALQTWTQRELIEARAADV